MQGDQFSSFQIGKMLNVSRQAVNQWIDKGFIASYRTPGGHRRVSRADLFEFLRDRDIPIPKELSEAAGEAQLPARIMILDDDENFLMLVKHALMTKIPQVEIQSLDNGYDALVAIGANRPDLLLLDPQMLGSDVRGVCQCLKRNKLTAQLPIMIVSDSMATDDMSADDVQAEKNLAIAATDQCAKSVPVMEIAERILDLLRHRGRTLVTH